MRARTASAKGGAEASDRNVTAKASLDRTALDGAPGRIRTFTKYKAAWSGGECIEVDARHTSQRRSSCDSHPKDHVETEHLKRGRATLDRFVCSLCRHEEYAGINAARNVLAHGRQRWAASPKTAGVALVAAYGGLHSKRAVEAESKDRRMKRIAA